MPTKKPHSLIKKSILIPLPDKKITVGPGNVPSYSGSASYTNIPEVLKALRKASKDGIFEVRESNTIEYNERPANAKR